MWKMTQYIDDQKCYQMTVVEEIKLYKTNCIWEVTAKNGKKRKGLTLPPIWTLDNYTQQYNVKTYNGKKVQNKKRQKKRHECLLFNRTRIVHFISVKAKLNSPLYLTNLTQCNI